MTTMVGLGRETISKMGDFADLILPAMATLTAATGSVTGAAVRQGVTVIFSDLLITAVDSLLVPLVYAYIALSCAQAALGNGGLGKLAGLVRGTAVFFLTAMLLAFTGYLTASGAIAGSVDAAVVKTARMTISRRCLWWEASSLMRRKAPWPAPVYCGGRWAWQGCWWCWPSA